MCFEVFDEVDSFNHFFPKFYMPVGTDTHAYTHSHDNIQYFFLGGVVTQTSIEYKTGSEPCSDDKISCSDNDSRNNVAMHVASLIHLAFR